MPSPQQTGKQRLLALAAGHTPRPRKPVQDLRAHGGKVKGPGTPTSDSIDAKLSKDEFVLPADTTRKVGLRRLMKLIDATHKPTGKPKKSGHYADGGLVEGEEEQRAAVARQPAAPTPVRVQTPSPTAMFVEDAAQEAGRRWDQGDVAGAIGAGARTAVGGVGMAAIEALDNTVGAASRGFMDGAKKFAAGFAGNETQATQSENGAPAPAVASDSTSIATPSMQADQSTTNAALDAGESAAAGVRTPVSEQVSPGIYKHGDGQYSDRAEGMSFGTDPTAQPSAADHQRAANLAQSTNPEAAYLQSQMQSDGSGSGAGAQRSPVGMTVEDAQAAGLIGERIGHNPAYDQRLNAPVQIGSMAGNGDASSQAPSRPRESWTDFTKRMIDMERGTSQGQVPQMRAPTVATSLNDYSVRKRLENLKTGASSIMNTARWGGKNAHLNSSVKAYQDALEADTQAILSGQADMDAKALQANANLQEEGMRQSGANRRDVRRTGVDLLKLGQDQQRLGMDAREHSLRARGLSRTDALQEQVFSAQTPEQMSSARARLLALHGKSDQEQTKWRSGNDQNGIPFLYNESTSETRPVRAPAANKAPAEGSFVRGKDGFTYEVRNGVPVRIGG